MLKVLVPLATGFEEIEAVTIVDIVRRAGIEVVTAGLEGLEVEGSHGMTIRADTLLNDIDPDEYDLIALPGGAGGAQIMASSERLLTIIRKLHGRGRGIAAICAAPRVLQTAGVVTDRRITAHPGQQEHLTGLNLTDARTEVDGKVITGKSAGTAMEFAFQIVEQLAGREVVEAVNGSVFASLP